MTTAYPTTTYDRGSQGIARGGNIRIDRAEDGSLRGVRERFLDIFDFTLMHTDLVEAEAQTYQTFYKTDPSRAIEVTWRGNTYICYWKEEPEIYAHPDGGGYRWVVVSRLVGSRTSTIASLFVDYSQLTLGPSTQAAFSSDTFGYYRDASTYLVNGGSDPRYWHDTGGSPVGILLEPAYNAIAEHTDDPFNIPDPWTVTNINGTTGQADPFNGSGAFDLDEQTAAGYHHISRALGPLSGNRTCVSAIFKYVDMPYVSLGFQNATGGIVYQTFNIQTVALGSAIVDAGSPVRVSAGIENFGNSFVRCWLGVDNGTTGGTPTMYVGGASSDGTAVNYTGTNRSFVVDAMHAHEGTHPYIAFPVGDFGVNSFAARAVDVLTYPAAFIDLNDFFVEVTFEARDLSQITGSVPERYLFACGDLFIKVVGNAVRGGYTFGTSGDITVTPGTQYTARIEKSAEDGLTFSVGGSSSNIPSALQDIQRGLLYVGSDSMSANHAACPIVSIQTGRL